MGHVIEEARSARAKCRKCKQPIAKGELRFGEEVPNPFAAEAQTSHRYYHLSCAAAACPVELGETLAAYVGPVPEREALELQISEGKKRQKPRTFPYAERAPSGRSRCLVCGEPIEKNELRIAVEREIETGGFVTRGAGYLHVRCGPEHAGETSLLAEIKAHSPALSAEEIAELTHALEG